MRTLKLNSKGPDVQRWQEFLAAKGFDLGPVEDRFDGKFGKNTRAATVAFQTKFGLSVDGKVGKKTVEKAVALGFAVFEDADKPVPTVNRFSATKQKVQGRGVPPDSYLDELVAWGRSASAEIFASNSESYDVFGKQEMVSIFGPWEGRPGNKKWLLHRKAVMLEILRCLGGFESSWNWKEGVDRTNKTSMANIEGQETGIFQVSYDSLRLEKNGTTLRACVEKYCGGSHDIQDFIPNMKSNHQFALEYCARLLRINYRWDGPILRNEINSSLKPDAVQEFKALLAKKVNMRKRSGRR